jgi:hypothetical protein
MNALFNFIYENPFAFIFAGSIILYFVIRDITRWFYFSRYQKKIEQDMQVQEKELKNVLKRIRQNKNDVMAGMADVEKHAMAAYLEFDKLPDEPTEAEPPSSPKKPS